MAKHGLMMSLAAAAGILAAAAAAAPLSDAQRQALDEYCLGCHNFEDFAGGLDLSALVGEDMRLHAADWEKVIRKLRAGMMPPPEQPRPLAADYDSLTTGLEAAIDSDASVNPGRVGLHRLNRAEYANAIRDLLALEIDTAGLLPADTSARGFDNQAGSLTISPTLLEAYTSASARIARMAVGKPVSPGESVYAAPGDVSQQQRLPGMPFGSRGGLTARHNFPADGEYLFYFQNFGVGNFIAGEQLELSIDGERVHLFDYVGVGLNEGGNADKDGDLQVILPVRAGAHTVGATFILSNYRPSIDMIQSYDRISLDNDSFPQVLKHPVLGLMKIIGPFEPEPASDSPSMRKVFLCRPRNADDEPACARRIVAALARQAYRRPVDDEDLRPVLAFYEEGRRSGSFEDGIELALRRLLLDPKFLVRAEAVPADLPDGASYAVSDLELASRLSFFLWSSLPDEELIAVAADNRLSEPAEFERQVRRMLADPRAESLVRNFAQQWLYLRNLPGTSPDGIFYPNWDDELRQGFQRETELLFESILREDRSIVDLLDADYTYVNERLARHYGIPNIYGAHFRRVELGGEFDYRRGLLGQGSFLSVTFTENFRTSPVKRGVWVLENILGTPPPEPPPNVPALEEAQADAAAVRTLRDQMTRHRTEEPCATCHKIMDGIGFALDNFDADGAWRTLEGHPRKGDGRSWPIDATVVLWDGTTVTGPAGLREVLLKYSPQFVRFATEKLMTYATGRGVEYYDMPVIRRIVAEAEADDYRLSSLILGVVNSPAFRQSVKTGGGNPGVDQPRFE